MGDIQNASFVAIDVHWLLPRCRPAAADYSRRIAEYPALPPALGAPTSYVELSLLLVTTIMIFVSYVVSWRIGGNEFSMHQFYRNRLVRCYLGASRGREGRVDWLMARASRRARRD